MRIHKQTLIKGWACMAIVTLMPASTTSADEKRIYQTDSVGNIQYHKPSYTVRQDGRIIETDAVGSKQYHKQQYQIKGGKTYQTGSVVNIQHHKPAFTHK